MIPATEHTFSAHDGAAIFYRAWVPAEPARRALLLFHRGHEHSGRWQETVEALDLPETAVFAWDQRGHGQSPGKRGDAASVAEIVKDADEFARHIERAHGIRLSETAVLAASVGGVIAAAWVHDFAPPIRALVLAAPAFCVRLYVPLAIPFLRLRESLRPGGTVKSYVKARMLTHDPQKAAEYEADPLIFRQISVNLLLGLSDTGTRLVADAGAIRTPTLLLAAERDWVVDLASQRKFFERLGSPRKQMEVFPGAFHSLFQETDRAGICQRTRAFLLECFERPLETGDPAEADRGGHTRTEYDLLRAPGSKRWGVVRTALKTFGRLSSGIRLGWRAGFDSGATLDYVYENQPRGTPPIGRIIDWFYLNSPGWRGIRVRREHLERMLRSAMQAMHRAGRPVRILDIASGPGRYVLETMAREPEIPSSVLLRDYRQKNLDAARRLADRLGLQQVTTAVGDAFDRDALAAISPRPTIAIVSGLYELFPDNAPLQRSLAGIAAALEDDGVLIYTNQPWHPQMEFIARVLRNREGDPWIMRRRTQGEMDALVAAAGFQKCGQDIDRWGIFTVSAARRAAR